MTTPLIAQEIYLLERYSSLEYFQELYAAFSKLVETGYAALDEFMLHLPLDYRNRHTSEQPDITWGGRVLPNLSGTLGLLDKTLGYLEAGRLIELGDAGSVTTALIGMSRDFDWDWMSKPFQDEFDRQYKISSAWSSNIGFTATAEWKMGSLGSRYNESARGALNAPETWPIYRLNHAFRVRTGERAPRTGIYLPEVGESHPQFLVKGYEAWKANVGLDERGQQRRERAATVWTLVERVADEGGEVPGEESWRNPKPLNIPSVPGGKPCPKEGWWWTPAARGESGRRYFKEGEIMLDFKSDYGMVIWQWGGSVDDKKR